MTKTTKIGTLKVLKSQIIKALATNDRAIGRALVVLNNRQTTGEQQTQATREHNGRGFQPAHAYMGTSMAKFYQRTNYLSPKQLAYWRKPNAKGDMRIARYWRQLAEAAIAKAAGNPEIQ